ncbi:hypothetical protein GCM10009848_61280 [Micromonospora lupini]|uniref:Uncharacterized protein n=1 Tax=Micromonospora lupini str. Lupac 08 TaxID=1150864 RepID=I0L9Y1_9ACTN|nr:hypothetical protein MILUP08_45512 [Micromonospora lupini str. Lupac 08]
MEGPIETTPGRPLPQGPSRCMGCASWKPSQHDCGGDKILAVGLGWWCDCGEPECRDRQRGIWPTTPSLVERYQRRGKGRPKTKSWD